MVCSRVFVIVPVGDLNRNVPVATKGEVKSVEREIKITVFPTLPLLVRACNRASKLSHDTPYHRA